MADPFVVDRLWPDPATGVPLDELLSAYAAPRVRGRPSVSINMVTSVDGRAQVDGTAEGLGSLERAYGADGQGRATLHPI